MSFQREVSSLQKLLLKYIPANIEKGIITKETILKMDKIQLPSCVKSQKVKQEMINMVIAAGKFTDELVPVVFFYPKLTKIEFVGAKITAVFVKKLTMHCPMLQTVNMSGCFRITDEAVEILCKNCKGLKDLGLDNCRKLTDASIDALIAHATKLTSIDLGGNFNMTRPGLLRLIEKHENHSKFVKVHVSGHLLTDDAVAVIASKCKKLHSISVGYTAITEKGLIAMLERRKTITKLAVHWNTKVTDTLMYHMAEKCPNLQYLNVCGIKSISNEALMHLVQLKMNVIGDLNPEGSVVDNKQQDISTEDHHPPPAKKLKRINIKYTNISKETVANIKAMYPDIQIQT